MTNATRTLVIWAGDEAPGASERLSEALQGCGVDLEIARTMEQLRHAVEGSSRPVVLVRDDPSELNADAVLTVLDSVCRPVTVVALLDQPEFGRYYYLSARGVTCFCELHEDPDRIAGAIRWSAARVA